MKKRIVICADGTWNRPEQNLAQDFPTNILKLARAIQQPVAKDDNIPQQVFYDWGIGSYHSKVVSGITGKGLHKNIMDDYRGAPSDGSAWSDGCDSAGDLAGVNTRISRGGAWFDDEVDLRSAFRAGGAAWWRDNKTGFRVAQDLD